MTSAQATSTNSQYISLEQNFSSFETNTGNVTKDFSGLQSCNVVALVGNIEDKTHKGAIEIIARQPTLLLIDGPDGVIISSSDLRQYHDFTSNFKIQGHQSEDTPTYLGTDLKVSWIKHLNLKSAKLEAAANVTFLYEAAAKTLAQKIQEFIEQGHIKINENNITADKGAFEVLEQIWSDNVELNTAVIKYRSLERELNDLEANTIVRSRKKFEEIATQKVNKLLDDHFGHISSDQEAEIEDEILNLDETTNAEFEKQLDNFPTVYEKISEFAEEGGKTIIFVKEEYLLGAREKISELTSKGLKVVTLLPRTVPSVGQEDLFRQMKLVSIVVHSNFNGMNVLYPIPRNCLSAFPAPIISVTVTSTLSTPINFGHAEFQRMMGLCVAPVFQPDQIIRLTGCDAETAAFFNTYVSTCTEGRTDIIPTWQALLQGLERAVIQEEVKQAKMADQFRFEVIQRLMFLSGVGLRGFETEGKMAYSMKWRDEQWGLEITSTRPYSFDLSADICWIDIEDFFNGLQKSNRSQYQIDKGKKLVLTSRRGGIHLYSNPVSKFELEGLLASSNLSAKYPGDDRTKEIVEISGNYSVETKHHIYDYIVITAETNVQINVSDRGAQALAKQQELANVEVQKAIKKEIDAVRGFK